MEAEHLDAASSGPVAQADDHDKQEQQQRKTTTQPIILSGVTRARNELPHM